MSLAPHKIFSTFGITLCLLWAEHARASELLSLSLEELVSLEVTSRKFHEVFPKAPKPLTVVTRELIRDNSIDSIYDLALYVPNLSFRRSYSRVQERPVIRGISAVVGDQPVGTFVDGFAASGLLSSLSFHDVERVEVLRGPEASLYGRSTFAGAINIVRRQASRQAEVDASLRLVDDAAPRAQAWLSSAVGNNLALALSGASYERKSVYDNTLGAGDGDIGAERSASLGLLLDWELAEHWALSMRLDNARDRDGAIATHLQNSDANNCFLDTSSQYFCGQLQHPESVGFNHDRMMQSPSFERDVNTQRAQLDYRGAGLPFSLTLNRADSNGSFIFDGDLSEHPAVYSESQSQFTSEGVEWLSNLQFERMRILMGASIFNKDNREVRDSFLLLGESFTPASTSDIRNHIENTALFSSLELQLPSLVKATLDLRYSRDQIAFKTDDQNESTRRWYALSPRFTLSKELGQEWMTFASIAKGEKPGGFNPRLLALEYASAEEERRMLNFLSYDHENVMNYELGIRGAFNQGRALLSANIFYSELDNLQLSQSLSYLNADDNLVRSAATTNSGSAQSQGFEFELDALLSTSLKARFNLGYAHSQYIDTQTSAQENLSGDASVNGHRLPNAPLWTASAGLTYRYQNLSANISLFYESERYVAEHNLAELEALLAANLRLSYELNEWRFIAFAKNIGRGDTIESAARLGDARSFFVRRAFGVSLSEEPLYGLGVEFVLN